MPYFTNEFTTRCLTCIRESPKSGEDSPHRKLRKQADKPRSHGGSEKKEKTGGLANAQLARRRACHAFAKRRFSGGHGKTCVRTVCANVPISGTPLSLHPTPLSEFCGRAPRPRNSDNLSSVSLCLSGESLSAMGRYCFSINSAKLLTNCPRPSWR